jgi:hypothetical protein
MKKAIVTMIRINELAQAIIMPNGKDCNIQKGEKKKGSRNHHVGQTCGSSHLGKSAKARKRI